MVAPSPRRLQNGHSFITATIVYSPVRRFAMPVGKWDFYGPATAIIAYLVMYWEIQCFTRH